MITVHFVNSKFIQFNNKSIYCALMFDIVFSIHKSMILFYFHHISIYFQFDQLVRSLNIDPDSPTFRIITDGQLPLRQCLHPEACAKDIELPNYYCKFSDLRKEFVRYKSAGLSRALIPVKDIKNLPNMPQLPAPPASISEMMEGKRDFISIIFIFFFFYVDNEILFFFYRIKSRNI